jgi:hypothetical protein
MLRDVAEERSDSSLGLPRSFGSTLDCRTRAFVGPPEAKPSQQRLRFWEPSQPAAACRTLFLGGVWRLALSYGRIGGLTSWTTHEILPSDLESSGKFGFDSLMMPRIDARLRWAAR